MRFWGQWARGRGKGHQIGVNVVPVVRKSFKTPGRDKIKNEFVSSPLSLAQARI